MESLCMQDDVTKADDFVVEGYCFRCKMRKTMQGATETRMQNGKRAFHGTCITCGTRLFKIAADASTPSPPLLGNCP